MPSETKPFKPLAAVALVLAWLVPGAGHLYLRKRARGLVIFFAVGVTFWAGVAMGGVMTVYSQGENWWWFAADMLTGAHGLAAWKHHQQVFSPIQEKANRRFAQEGYGRLNEPERSEAYLQLIAQELERNHLALVSPGDTVARAYSGVAGLLNLLCVFDAMMLALMGRVGEPPPAPPAEAPVPAPARPPTKSAAAEARASLQATAGTQGPAATKIQGPEGGAA